jgi:signal transduction histidine kinase
MKAQVTLERVGLVAFLLVLLSGILIGTYFLTDALFHAIGHAPPPYLAQVINSLLGLLLYALTAFGIFSWGSLRPGAKRRWLGILEPIVEAMERIAKGDFQVRLQHSVGDNAIVGTLANSVNQMALELNQIEHMRQDFISNVSHEIQSPLTSIRGFAHALRDDQLGAQERHHYLSIIETESVRLSRLTDNMLKLASLESAQLQFDRKPYRLDKQIRSLILACEPQWSGKALDVDAALEEVIINADEDLLSQVWSNLLHNSVKFTPEGGRVSVTVRREGSQFTCRICDTGIGIPEDAQPHVFERFYKADPSRERAREGSGLGLAIAKKIVELHQGTIGVTSQPGDGTTVIVSLPAS